MTCVFLKPLGEFLQAITPATRQAVHLSASRASHSPTHPQLPVSSSSVKLLPVSILAMLCDAEGLHPMMAIRRYHIIEGRPTLRADAMQADFQRSGGRIRWEQSDAEVCRAVFVHPDRYRFGQPACHFA